MKTNLQLREGIGPLRTLVIKAGSRVVTAGHEREHAARLDRLAADIAALRRQAVRVLLVSSGAIAHGMRVLGMATRPKAVPMQQACASVGQSRMMEEYGRFFARHDVTVGQVLLTWDDLRDKRRYLNLRNTLFQLLDCGVLPIINENDSVGVEEIRVGDNDTLGAQIALLVGAELYVMLTDVNGLYRANPARVRTAEHIPVVHGVTSEIQALAGGAGSGISVGGMATKVRAADIVTRSGLCAMIADGDHDRLLDILTQEGRGTLFVPAPRRLSARRRWIAFARHVSGTLTIDAGAERALVRQGRSLLPAGVRRHTGSFKPGDMVAIAAEDGRVIGRGLINYSAADLELIKGRRTDQIAGCLGHKPFDEVVHRDNLVLLAQEEPSQSDRGAGAVQTPPRGGDNG